jgi:hypothetical protein
VHLGVVPTMNAMYHGFMSKRDSITCVTHEPLTRNCPPPRIVLTSGLCLGSKTHENQDSRPHHTVALQDHGLFWDFDFDSINWGPQLGWLGCVT